jgi:hypothetical protein
MITIIMENDYAYPIHSPCSCRGCTSACPAVAAEDPLGDIPWHPQVLAGALVVLAGLPEFIKPFPFPVPLGLTLGLLLPDLLLRRA